MNMFGDTSYVLEETHAVRVLLATLSLQGVENCLDVPVDVQSVPNLHKAPAVGLIEMRV